MRQIVWYALKRSSAAGTSLPRARATARHEKIRRRTIGRLSRRPRHSWAVVARRAAGASERWMGLPVTFRQLPEVKVCASGDASTLDRGGIPAYPSSPR
jgi:hypothetical protein